MPPIFHTCSTASWSTSSRASPPHSTTIGRRLPVAIMFIASYSAGPLILVSAPDSSLVRTHPRSSCPFSCAHFRIVGLLDCQPVPSVAWPHVDTRRQPDLLPVLSSSLLSLVNSYRVSAGHAACTLPACGTVHEPRAAPGIDLTAAGHPGQQDPVTLYLARSCWR